VLISFVRSAPLLIALPGISPRIVTGRKELTATLVVSEIIDERALSPSLYGERMPAGR
jgi:hypothetical protein